jgi:hypothetical protein
VWEVNGRASSLFTNGITSIPNFIKILNDVIIKFILTDIADEYLAKIRYGTMNVNILLSFVQINVNVTVTHNELFQSKTSVFIVYNYVDITVNSLVLRYTNLDVAVQHNLLTNYISSNYLLEIFHCGG